MNRQEILDLMNLFDIHPTHSLGQNFLADDRLAKYICHLGQITRDDLVIEIGAGIGSLTRELSGLAGRVVSIEIDQRLLPALRSQIPPSADCRIINADALEIDLAGLADEWTGPVKVAANLPYYITTPLIEKVICELPCCREMILMVQKEAAGRILAEPGSKQYGPLSILAASHGQVRRDMIVPASSFIPQPHVHSCLIRINDAGKLQIESWIQYKAILEKCFAYRRKTLLNGLKAAGFTLDQLSIVKAFLSARGKQLDIRAEMLKIQDFYMLAEILALKN
jgi:16S rRNA (adenine1518-N6/adenine1519-N6)-dimethyltransferase